MHRLVLDSRSGPDHFSELLVVRMKIVLLTLLVATFKRSNAFAFSALNTKVQSASGKLRGFVSTTMAATAKSEEVTMFNRSLQ